MLSLGRRRRLAFGKSYVLTNGFFDLNVDNFLSISLQAPSASVHEAEQHQNSQGHKPNQLPLG
jgi:hypothetical protein